MASERQIAANRRNALRSTGPRTPAGKLIVAGNSICHGILARGAVLPGVEDVEEWDSHQRGVLASLRPAGLLETRLAERVAELLWRLGRVARYESLITAVRLEEAADVLDDEGRLDDGGLNSVSGCRARIVEAETTTEALRRLERQGDGEALPASAARALFELALNLVCPERMNCYVDQSFWASLEVTGFPSFDDVAWTAGMVRKALAHFGRPRQLGAEELCRRMSRLLDRALADAQRRMTHLEAAARTRRAALEVAVGREQVRRLLPDVKTEQRLERYERHLSRELRDALATLERLQGQRIEQGGPEPMDGDLAADPEQPPEPAHLATIGFASQQGSNAAAAPPSVADGKDAHG